MRWLVQNRDSPTFVSLGYLAGRWCGVQPPKQIRGRLLSWSEACSPAPSFLISSWPTPHRGPPKCSTEHSLKTSDLDLRFQCAFRSLSDLVERGFWFTCWGGPEILCFWTDPNWCLSVWSMDSILKSKGLITDCLWPFTSFDLEFLLLFWLCLKKKICCRNVSIKGNILKYTNPETDLGYEGDRKYLFLNCECLKHL